MKYNDKVVVTVLIALLSYLSYTTQAMANVKEVIVNGGFEYGMVNFEIYKYPVYPDVTKVTRSVSNAISGQYSLELPHVHKGGYKFVLPMLLLNIRDSVDLSALISSKNDVQITIEAFVRKKRVYKKHLKLKKNQKTFTHKLASGIVGKDSSPVSFVMWIKSKSHVLVDDISFKTTGSFSDKSGIGLVSDNPLGVFGIKEEGAMVVSGTNNISNYTYRIYDQIKNNLILEGNIGKNNSSKFNLYTKKRGSYRVEIINTISGKDIVLAWRLYSVINKASTNVDDIDRYGIAMEEYGYKQFQNALIRSESWYELASQIGASSVRLFTAAMPDVISKDGIYYDFTVSDNMLALSQKYNLEPLVELGSNVLHRLPTWLLTSSANNNINLNDGIRTKNLKRKFEKHRASPYLDMKAYRKYLVKVMSHFGNKVSDYELWNEPGHKFKTNDFFQIAKLTRDVQKEYAKHAQLVGFSSTKGKGFGRGVEVNLLPAFASEMLSICSECIDILSYHGEHAYMFLGFSIDYRNQETGYPERLRLILNKHPEVKNISLWNTERGIKWFSPHTERIDHMNNASGREMNESKRESVSVNEVARRLPAVYAAAFSSGVDKLFWFYMNAGSMTSARSHGRSGFFDANLEPMPHLPVYDAMTEIVADAEFMSFLDKLDGTRVYEFKRNDTTVLLAFNWKQDNSEFSIDYQGVEIVLHDIVGEITEFIKGDGKGQKKISVNGWPQYILIHNVSNGSFSVH